MMTDDERFRGIAIYALYLVALFTGVPFFIGVILAYIFRGSGSPAIVSHFEHQIGLFWRIFLGGIISGALIGFGALLTSTMILLFIGIPLILLGALGLLWTWLMMLTRSIRGIGRLNQNAPYPVPAGWGL